MQGLAKLSDIKSRLGWSENSLDDKLRRMMLAATAIAEGNRCARRPLMRAAGAIEYPRLPGRRDFTRSFRVKHFPIEHIIGFKYFGFTCPADDYDEYDDLVENQDYFVDYGDDDRGVVNSIGGKTWLLDDPRSAYIIYTGGYHSPEAYEVYFDSDDAANIHIREGEALLAATEVELQYTGGSIAVADLVDDAVNCIWLEDDGNGAAVINHGTAWPQAAAIGLASVTVAAGAVTDVTDRRTFVFPPRDLQTAVEDQTIAMWRKRSLSGTDSVSAGRGGSVQFKDDYIVPSLITACQALQFWDI